MAVFMCTVCNSLIKSVNLLYRRKYCNNNNSEELKIKPTKFNHKGDECGSSHKFRFLPPQNV